ncbi:MAG: hypothetical protein ACRD4Y_17000, partial [Candidatus Acidiferrales bacterium]
SGKVRIQKFRSLVVIGYAEDGLTRQPGNRPRTRQALACRRWRTSDEKLYHPAALGSPQLGPEFPMRYTGKL